MKTFNPKNLLMVALVATLSLNAHAGTRDAGGGTGIMVNGRLIVLDLVEAGVERNPYLPAITPSRDIVNTLQKSLNAPAEFKAEILQPLAAKLTDIDQAAHPAGLYMAAALSVYQIKVTSLKLNNIDDTDSAIGEPKIQIAERKGSQIWINIDRWNQLDLANKVALLTHEIAYAFQPAPVAPHLVEGYCGGLLFRRHCDSEIEGGTEADAILATSAKARVLNGYFYRPDWHDNWLIDLAKEMTYDGGGSYALSHLFGVMSDGTTLKVGQVSRVVGFADDDDGRLVPRFRSLAVTSGYGDKKKVQALRATSSRAEISRLCGRLATKPEMRDTYASLGLFNVTTGKEAEEFSTVDINVNKLDRSFSHVTISADSSTVDANAVYAALTTGRIGECVKSLQQIQKEYMVR